MIRMHAAVLAVLALAATVAAEPVFSLPADQSEPEETLRLPTGDVSFGCSLLPGCPPHGNGRPDRQVQPFEGTLGRPCAYRWRATPSGTRKVRVCF